MSTATPGPAVDTLDVAAIRRDFPVLGQSRGDRRLVFLDSAASAQKPRAVVEAMSTFAESEYANVHRGVYGLSEAATARYEGARAAVARFIGAPRAEEVVFTKNATEGLNLVAGSWGRANLGPGDAVVLSQMEHHSNIVPWFQLQAEKGFEIRWLPVCPDGLLDLSALDRLLDGAKLLGLTAMSNVLGTLPPVRRICDAAHAAGALVSLDACQYVPHLATDVVALDADFVAFSGHKMVGPTGIGVLWARSELLEAMPPFLGGGGMILTVDLDGFTPDVPPPSSRPGPPRSSRPSASTPPSTTSTPWAWTRSGPTRSASRPTPCARSPSASAIASPSTGRRSRPSGAGSCPWPSTTCTPTTWPR